MRLRFVGVLLYILKVIVEVIKVFLGDIRVVRSEIKNLSGFYHGYISEVLVKTV